MVVLVSPPISPISLSTDKGNVLVWHDCGHVLACDRISSLVTYMKVRREGLFGHDFMVDLMAAFCFTFVFYIPLRVHIIYYHAHNRRTFHFLGAYHYSYSSSSTLVPKAS